MNEREPTDVTYTSVRDRPQGNAGQHLLHMLSINGGNAFQRADFLVFLLL